MSKHIVAIDELLAHWMGSPRWRHVVEHRIIDSVGAQTQPVPDWVAAPLRRALEKRGITRLYSHQAHACDKVHRDPARRGQDIVVATPTASGKTLCYNLPVLHALLCDAKAQALYLFPTKALARDQIEAVRQLSAELPQAPGVVVYDGDTPVDQRRAARRKARLIATNPEMLHSAILPHHPTWSRLLSGLRYVVIDELHVYRGVFGSQLAHVLWRLQRIARFHGADPTFICCSATIANPAELATELLGRPVECISSSGAPSGRRHFILYNPPLIDAGLGLRQNYLNTSCTLAKDLLDFDINHLVFCRTRLAVEVLLRNLRQRARRESSLRRDPPSKVVEEQEQAMAAARIRAYRGGYLPQRRREVEAALREGKTTSVVSTSALELGIDIGTIDAVIVAGWPGSRAAALQRAGRAGRRLAPSLAILVASSDPLDQFVAQNPEFFLEHAPEQARINAHNAEVLVPQIKCAAYELPFSIDDGHGPLSSAELAPVLSCLAGAGLLHRSGQSYRVISDNYPANEVKLRGPMEQNYLVVRQAAPSSDSTQSEGNVIAEVDYNDATQELHPQAIYQLEGQQYQVMRLDHQQHKAYVVPVEVDYYTDALMQTRVRILETQQRSCIAISYGDVHVLQRVAGFKKIKVSTRENLGYGEVSEPDREMHTTAVWMLPPAEQVRQLGRSAGELAEAALCAARALHSAAALMLLGDKRDIGRAVGDARSGWFPVAGVHGRGAYGSGDTLWPLPGALPTIFLFDRYPGGIGLCRRLFDDAKQLLQLSRRLIARCPCEAGCPACIGPGATELAKPTASALLDILTHAPQAAEHTAAQTPGRRSHLLPPSAASFRGHP